MISNLKISKKYIDHNNTIINKFNTFLLSDIFMSRKLELEKAILDNELTVRNINNKSLKIKYIRRSINDPYSNKISLSDILNIHKKKNSTILISNYIEDINNNNFIEENILYTNYNLENYSGEDVSTKNKLIKSYNKDLIEAKKYHYIKNKCNEKYFDIEFKILNILGKNNSKKLLFGEHIKNIWKNNKKTKELKGYIKYILKLIDSIDYFSKVYNNISEKDHNLLNNNLNRILDMNQDIKYIIGNYSLNFGIYKNKNNKLCNTTLEKYNEILIIFCSFLLLLDRTEYDFNSTINNEYTDYENKIYSSLKLNIKKLDIISITNIYLQNKYIIDYKIYFVFLYLKNLINTKHYYRDNNFKYLKKNIYNYIQNFTFFNHGDINKIKKEDLSNYLSIINLYKICNQFLNKELFFECNKSNK